MLDGYHQQGTGIESRRRIIAVDAALEIIKASIAASTNSKNVGYDLEQAIKNVGPLADAIQAAIGKE